MKPTIFRTIGKEQNCLRIVRLVYLACFCKCEKTRSNFLKTCENDKSGLNQVLINVDLVLVVRHRLFAYVTASYVEACSFGSN